MAIIYIPSLVGLLVKAEQKKGTLLTKQEVEQIRDSATCISIPDRIAQGMDPTQTYCDIDPATCWEEWASYRVAGLAKTA